MSKTRRREQCIEIRASVEAVWKAITDAEEIIRWYSPEAGVSLSEGGRYWVSWGEGMAGASRIARFDKNRHLRLVHESEEPTKPDEPMVEEYFLESDGEITVLRLVQSGIPAAAGRCFLPDFGTTWSDISVRRARTSCSCSPCASRWTKRGRSSWDPRGSPPKATSKVSVPASENRSRPRSGKSSKSRCSFASRRTRFRCASTTSKIRSSRSISSAWAGKRSYMRTSRLSAFPPKSSKSSEGNGNRGSIACSPCRKERRHDGSRIGPLARSRTESRRHDGGLLRVQSSHR